MKRESLAFALAGTFFGVLMGWIIGSQNAAPPAPAPTAAAAPPADAVPAQAPAPTLDSARVSALEQQAAAEPKNAAVRADLGNLYFDAERYDQAVTWYEGALRLDPKNVDVSTDLAIVYFYTNQVDRALTQIEHSLALNPKHLKALLNQGVIRAFGKQDLVGAAESWERVLAIAPDSQEGRAAKQGLDGIKAAHPGTAPGGSAPAAGGRK